MTRGSRASRVSRVGVIGVLLAVLVGCGDGVPGPGASTSVPIAEGSSVRVVWPYGEPDDGRWADHEAVQVLRRADLAIATAYYLHDWSSEELAATVDAGTIQRRYRGETNYRLGEVNEAWRVSGPIPRIVLDVAEIDFNGRVGYEVTSCVPDHWRSLIGAGQDPRGSTISVNTFVLVVGSDGVLRTQDDPWAGSHFEPDSELAPPSCDLSKLRYGYFDPVQPETYTYLRSEVVGPDGEVGPVEE